MTRTSLAAVCAATALSGCVAPEACGDDLAGEQLSSVSLGAERTFSEAGELSTVRLLVTLRVLSELWPAEHPIHGASVDVLIRLAYADGSETGDVATQLPRFNVRLENPASSVEGYGHDTPSFPPSSGIHEAIALFRDCYEGDELNCCEYGSTECSFEAVLSYRRLDGDPFPPVRLSWEATAHASVDTCPLAQEPKLSLEMVEP